ncbi:MAG: hypothetical protein QNJ97_24335 [Myxococcota bacterium]|nr:hypothetical protein [Myxococcota bacterium]
MGLDATVLGAYTNQGQGIEAPFGVVNTYWSMLEVPYSFGNGKWFSFWTVNNDCAWGDSVITLGLENTSNRLTPAHIINTGGTVEFAEDAPVLPLNQWVRTTIYINYHRGEMHIWQDGQDLLHATFSRSDTDICQWRQRRHCLVGRRQQHLETQRTANRFLIRAVV